MLVRTCVGRKLRPEVIAIPFQLLAIVTQSMQNLALVLGSLLTPLKHYCRKLARLPGHFVLCHGGTAEPNRKEVVACACASTPTAARRGL